MSNHPITPPPELVSEWANMFEFHSDAEVFNKVASWGADQELQECINFVYDNMLCDSNFYKNLRDARRPKPPSLKELALEALREAESSGCLYVNGRSDTIRKALEALPND